MSPRKLGWLEEGIPVYQVTPGKLVSAHRAGVPTTPPQGGRSHLVGAPARWADTNFPAGVNVGQWALPLEQHSKHTAGCGLG